MKTPTSNEYFYKEKCKRLEAIIEVLYAQVEDLMANETGYPSETVEYMEVDDECSV